MKKRSTLVFGILFLTLVLGISGYFYFSNMIVMNEIALRFQVTPSWGSIKHFLDKKFEPEMTKGEIHPILDLVGPWFIQTEDDSDEGGWDPDTKQLVFREVIIFTEFHTSQNIKGWVFLYDSQGKLVRQTWLDS